MTALSLLKDQLKGARESFAGTVGDIRQEQLAVDPGGKALPLGATYVHAIMSEDAIMQGMIQNKTPLYAGDWKDKTGVSEPIPPMDENWSAANTVWAKNVQIDLEKLKEYSQAVFSATDAYINTVQDEDLEREIDLGSWGKKSVAELLSSYIIAHINNLTGEISALKGMQGAKGYPY